MDIEKTDDWGDQIQNADKVVEHLGLNIRGIQVCEFRFMYVIHDKVGDVIFTPNVN